MTKVNGTKGWFIFASQFRIKIMQGWWRMEKGCKQSCNGMGWTQTPYLSVVPHPHFPRHKLQATNAEDNWEERNPKKNNKPKGQRRISFIRSFIHPLTYSFIHRFIVLCILCYASVHFISIISVIFFFLFPSARLVHGSGQLPLFPLSLFLFFLSLSLFVFSFTRFFFFLLSPARRFSPSIAPHAHTIPCHTIPSILQNIFPSLSHLFRPKLK